MNITKSHPPNYSPGSSNSGGPPKFNKEHDITTRNRAIILYSLYYIELLESNAYA